jgi:hypothetical protein
VYILTPSLIGENEVDRSGLNAILGCKPDLGGAASSATTAYLADLGPGEFGHRVGLATRGILGVQMPGMFVTRGMTIAAILYAVPSVVDVRAEIEMLMTHTPATRDIPNRVSVLALVTDEQSVWDGTIRQLPSETMGHDGAVLSDMPVVESSVTPLIQLASPQPAGIGTVLTVHPLPEPIFGIGESGIDLMPANIAHRHTTNAIQLPVALGGDGGALSATTLTEAEGYGRIALHGEPPIHCATPRGAVNTAGALTCPQYTTSQGVA